MAKKEFELAKGAMLRIDAAEGDRLRVRFGDVWVTQHHDTKDYVLRAGDSMILSGKGATLAVAYKATVLELHPGASAARVARREPFLRRAAIS